jgi:hypothetical protein
MNSIFYKKNNLDKNCPYNGLEQEIYSLSNDGSIIFLQDFNVGTTNQALILSNDSNHNPVKLDEDLVLASIYKRNSKDLVETLFGTKLIKLYSSQDLIICNGLMKWTKSNWMTSIYGLGTNVVNYVIYNIHVYNQIVNFDLLNDHNPNSYHRPLTLTLNFVMHKISIEDNFDNQKHLIFDKNKADLFLKDLNNKLNLLSNQNNINVP